MNLVLNRFHQDSLQTLGTLSVYSPAGLLLHSFATLELPWRENDKKISRIPPSKYEVEKRTSGKFGQHFILKHVVNRDFILIHKGNYVKDTSGCILVGLYFQDLNKDNYLDIANSSVAMYGLLQSFTGNMGTLTINDCFTDPNE